MPRRAVVDASVLVSAFLFPDSVPGRVLKAAHQAKFTLHLSPLLLDETRYALLSTPTAIARRRSLGGARNWNRSAGCLPLRRLHNPVAARAMSTVTAPPSTRRHRTGDWALPWTRRQSSYPYRPDFPDGTRRLTRKLFAEACLPSRVALAVQLEQRASSLIADIGDPYRGRPRRGRDARCRAKSGVRCRDWSVRFFRIAAAQADRDGRSGPAPPQRSTRSGRFRPASRNSLSRVPRLGDRVARGSPAYSATGRFGVSPSGRETSRIQFSIIHRVFQLPCQEYVFRDKLVQPARAVKSSSLQKKRRESGRPFCRARRRGGVSNAWMREISTKPLSACHIPGRTDVAPP
jgi:hypothetical protein